MLVDVMRPRYRRPVTLRTVLESLYSLHRKVDHLMADLTALNAAMDELASEEGSVVTELQRLSAIIAEGGSVSQADIDAVTAKVQSVSQGLKDAVAADPQG